MRASILVLKVGFLLLGSVAVLIGTSNYFLGIAVTADTLASMLAPAGLESGEFDYLATPSVDNEFRFYAVLWVAYGIFSLVAAKRLPQDLHC